MPLMPFRLSLSASSFYAFFSDVFFRFSTFSFSPRLLHDIIAIDAAISFSFRFFITPLILAILFSYFDV
jgi:hypothetical protein